MGLLFALLGSGCAWVVDPDPALIRGAVERCDNAIDDDEDGLFDCADPTCAGTPGCLERSAERCTNGRDDDADGRADCADADCGLFAACYDQVRFARSDACPPAVRRELESSFLAEEAPGLAWLLRGDAGALPEPTARGLRLTPEEPGVDPLAETRLTVRDPVRIAASTRLVLQTSFRLVGGLGRRDPPTTVSIRLDADGASEPALLLRLELARRGGFAPRGADLSVDASCTFLRRTANSPTRLGDGSSPITLELELDGDGFRLVATATTSSQALARCELPPPTDDRGLSLSLSGRRGSRNGPGVVLERVSLRSTDVRPGCRGAFEPLLAPSFCALPGVPPLRRAGDATTFRLGESTYVAGRTDGRATALVAAWPELTVIDDDRRTALDWPRVRAVDARVGLIVAPPSAFVGSVSAFADEGRRALGPITLDGQAPPLGFPATIVPDPVQPGRFLAYASRLRAGRDRPEIEAAVSTDGVTWITEPIAGLDVDAGWSASSQGVLGLAAVTTAEGVILVYDGVGVAGPRGVGLARADDGRRFRPHAFNPVLFGQEPGLDDAGVGPRALWVEDGELVMAYVGRATQPGGGCLGSAATSDGAGIALARIAPRPRVP